MLAGAGRTAHASTATYNFTYNGTGTGAFTGKTDTGTGSFTYMYTAGNTAGTLSTFSFSDTLYSALGPSSTFSYNSGDVASDTVLLNSLGALTYINVTTTSKTGSNNLFGEVSFNLTGILPVVGGSTTPASFALFSVADASIGTVTLTPAAVAATPEPGTLALVGTGVTFCGQMVRRRMSRA